MTEWSDWEKKIYDTLVKVEEFGWWHGEKGGLNSREAFEVLTGKRIQPK